MFKVAWQVWILAAIVNLANCSPVRGWSPYVVKDVHNPPSRWRKIGPAPGDHVLNLQIGLKQDRFHELERKLYEGT
jgi:tripeptidyl-peptidase I